MWEKDPEARAQEARFDRLLKDDPWLLAENRPRADVIKQ